MLISICLAALLAHIHLYMQRRNFDFIFFFCKIVVSSVIFKWHSKRALYKRCSNVDDDYATRIERRNDVNLLTNKQPKKKKKDILIGDS